MRYSELCEVYEKLAGTTKRLEKIEILSEFLKKVSVEEKEVLYLLLGRVFPDYYEKKIGISDRTIIKAIAKSCGISEEKIIGLWKKIGDLGDVAFELMSDKRQASLFSRHLTIDRIVRDVTHLTDLEGKGTVGNKIDVIVGIFNDSTPVEARYIVRLLLEDLRIGIQISTVREAISASLFGGDKEASEKIQRAYDSNPDIAFIFEIAKKGLSQLDKVSISTGKPLKAMLAQKVDSISEGFEVVGKPAAFEYKYDGFRVIISKDKDEINLFTRRLDNVTKQFPDVVEFVRKYVRGESFILDAEVVGYDKKTKKYVPFQIISQRIKRKYEIEKMVEEFPVEVNAFDVLNYDGESLINKPFIERTKLLRKIVKSERFKLVCAKQIITDSEKEAQKFFDEALEHNEEGLMIKNLQGIYKPGSRVGYMVKLKPEHRDFDLVIVGAEHGNGKRSKWLSSFIVACKDTEGNLLEVGMVSSGLKEKKEEGITYEDMTKLLKPLIISSEEKTVRVKPKIVIAVTYQEIQKSPTYSSGYALRFPRFTALREDKPVSEINSIRDIEKEYRKQRR